MSKVAPWISLSIDWQDSEMFDDATHGLRLAWVCLLCHAKAQGRAGKVRFRGKKFAEKYRLNIGAVDELLARASRDGAILIEGDYVIVVNWKSYQDPRVRATETTQPNTPKHVTPKRRRFTKTNKNDATHHPSPITHHPPPPPPSDGWRKVEEEVFGFGVAKAVEAVSSARNTGCNLNHVCNVVEYWRSHQPDWGPGALYDRLMRLRPDQGFDQCWPPVVSGSGVRQVTAEEFRELFGKRRFVGKPQHHATKPEIVFGTLRTGEKIECRNYPVKTKQESTA